MSTTDRKIIHCVCPLETHSESTPFSSYIPKKSSLPLPPPITPIRLSSKKQCVRLNVSSSDTFEIYSNLSWRTINATANKSRLGYNQSICIIPDHQDSINSQEMCPYITHVLDPLFNTSSKTVVSEEIFQSDRSQIMWKKYLVLNEAYAEMAFQHYEDEDLVWIHDYQLLMVPYFLRKMIPNVKIGLSVYVKFPYWEHISKIYGHKEILNSMLRADHIGFQTKLDTRHFATASHQLLNLSKPPSSKQISVLSSNFDSRLTINSSVFERAKSIRDMFPEKRIIFCRDSHASSVIRTLAAFAELLSKEQNLRDNLVLIHLCSTSIPAGDLKAVPEIARLINQLYGNTGSVPVHLYHKDIDKEEQQALMAASDIGMLLGTDLSTLETAREFVLCQHQRHSPLILSSSSQFLITNNKEFTSTEVANTFSIPNIMSTLQSALNMCPTEAHNQHEVLFQLILEQETSDCINQFIQLVKDYNTAQSYNSLAAPYSHNGISIHVSEDVKINGKIHRRSTTRSAVILKSETNIITAPTAVSQCTNKFENDSSVKTIHVNNLSEQGSPEPNSYLTSSFPNYTSNHYVSDDCNCNNLKRLPIKSAWSRISKEIDSNRPPWKIPMVALF